MKAFDNYNREISEKKKSHMKKYDGKRGTKDKMEKHNGNKMKKNGEKREKINEKKSADPINLSKDEVQALKSLKDKIKEGHIIVCPTDKSSRFAVLTKHQYLEAGRIHTEKDKEIS